MSDIYLAVEDYLWFSEDIQGNVNVAGLVFDDFIDEAVDLGHEAYVVWTDQIEETIGFTEGFVPTHWPEVSETIDLRELFGAVPTRVRQSVLNVIYTKPMMPVRIGHMHMDVLVGSDTFIEEVSSELQCHSSYANAVPYWWETVHESVGIDMEEPQPLPPYTITRKLVVTDLVNMRHIIVQDYEFNSLCHERLFIWADYAWGWSKLLADSLDTGEAIQEIIGKMADEHIHFGDGSVPLGETVHVLNDTLFIFDASELTIYATFSDEYGIQLAAEDGFDVEDETKNDQGATLAEALGISEAAERNIGFHRLAVESLRFADAVSAMYGMVVEEGLDLGDVELALWTFNALVECGFDMGDIIG